MTARAKSRKQLPPRMYPRICVVEVARHRHLRDSQLIEDDLGEVVVRGCGHRWPAKRKTGGKSIRPVSQDRRTAEHRLRR